MKNALMQENNKTSSSNTRILVPFREIAVVWGILAQEHERVVTEQKR
jgi:hypothetical protein